MKIRAVDSARFQLIFFFALAFVLCVVTRSFSLADDDFPSDVMDSVEPPPIATAGESAKAKPPVETKTKAKVVQKVEKKPALKPKAETKVAKVAKAEKPAETMKPEAAVKTDKPEKAAAPAKTESKEKSGKEEGLKTLKTIDKRYQDAKSITMDVDKTLVNSVIGTEKKSKGSIILSKGRMRMEIVDPSKSIIVIDGKNIWVADYPKAELKDAPVQVLKGSVKETKGASKSFVGLLAQGAITKYFKVIDVQKDDSGRRVYFMQPTSGSVEFKRSQITLTADEKQIAELRYWDEQDNETRMIFSNVKFDKPVSEETFQFKLPPNADVSQI